MYLQDDFENKTVSDFNDFLILCQRGRQVHYFDIVVPFLEKLKN